MLIKNNYGEFLIKCDLCKKEPGSIFKSLNNVVDFLRAEKWTLTNTRKHYCKKCKGVKR